MGLRGVVRRQLKKTAKGVGNQLPGFGELRVKKGKPQPNKAGDAVRKLKGK